MNIVVFEDDPAFSRKLESMVRQYTHHPTALNTADRQDVAEYIQSSHPATLYFLDIMAGGQAAGLDVAETISSTGGIIVFLTAFPEKLTGNHRYLTRSFTQIYKHSGSLADEIRHTIDLALEVVGERCLRVAVQSETLYIPFEDISCIEKIKGTNKIRIMGQYIRCDAYGTLEHLLKTQLAAKPQFIRCHRSYIVNKRHVRSRTGNRLILQDGTACPVYSFRFRGAL